MEKSFWLSMFSKKLKWVSNRDLLGCLCHFGSFISLLLTTQIGKITVTATHLQEGTLLQSLFETTKTSKLIFIVSIYVNFLKTWLGLASFSPIICVSPILPPNSRKKFLVINNCLDVVAFTDHLKMTTS